MSDKPASYQLSPLARGDLADIWLHTFKTWSLEQADSYHNDTIVACEALAAGRKNGRSVEIRDGYFKYLSGMHAIYYRAAPHGIDIIRILHQMMDAERHL